MYKFNKTLFGIWLLLTLIACSSGGGSGGNSNSSGGSSGGSGGGSGNEPPKSNYSVALNASSITLELPYGGTAEPKLVSVNFVGDGLVVGYPPGNSNDQPVTAEILSNSGKSAVVALAAAPGLSYPELGTYSTVIRFATGSADGTEYVYKDLQVRIVQLDGFDIQLASSPVYSGIWGDGGHSAFVVRTFEKSWSVSSSSPGVRFTPESGKGTETVLVTYDPDETPVGSSEKTITFTAGSGESISKTISYQLRLPELSQLNDLIHLPNHDKGQSLSPVALSLNFQNGVAVPWTATASPWISLTSAEGVTGQNDIEFYVSNEVFPGEAENMNGVITVEFDIPGASFSREIQVNFPFEPFYIQAAPSAIAHSDYNTWENHDGKIIVNLPLNNIEGVTSSAPWLIIHDVSEKFIFYRLETTDLPFGYHEATISVAQPQLNGVVATQINVGYYKSELPATYGENGEWSSDAFAVADKLGPWLYIGRSDSPNSIAKYNFITKSVEETVVVEELEKIGALTISDDGKTLYGLSYDWGTGWGKLLQIHLDDFANYSIVNIDGPQSPDFLRYARFSGKSMVSDGGTWFDADTGARILYSGDHYSTRYSKTGEYFLAPSLYTPGGIFYSKYTYSYLTNELARTSLGSLEMDMRTNSLNLSTNEDWMVLVTANMEETEKTVTSFRLANEFDYTLETSGRMHLHFNDIEGYPWADVSGRGVIAVQVDRFRTTDEDERVLSLFTANLELIAEHKIDWFHYFAADWRTFTGDGKLFSSFVKQPGRETGTMYLYSSK